MAAKKKPVLGICATCGEQFTTQTSMTNHNPTHPRIASTTKGKDMERTEAVAKAEECFRITVAAIEEDAYACAAANTALGLAYLELAKLADA